MRNYKKSLSHRCKPCSHRCKPLLHQCNRLFLHFCTTAPNHLSHSPLTTLGQLGRFDSSPCPPGVASQPLKWPVTSAEVWGTSREALGFLFNQQETSIGRTPKRAYSPRGRSRHLLETPFSEPLLRTLLRTLFYCKTHSKPPSQNPSENPSPEPFPEPSQNPS